MCQYMYMYILVTHNLEVDIRAIYRVFIQTTQRAAVTSFLSTKHPPTDQKLNLEVVVVEI